MTLRILVGKLLLLPIAVENLIILAAALAGAVTWFSGELVQVSSSDPFQAFLAAFLTFARRVTLTFLIFGGFAWILGWIRIRTLSAPLGVKAESYPPWFFLVILILASSGALAGVFARPLPLMVQDGIRLLQSWEVWENVQPGDQLSGIYFLPVLGILLGPGLAAMAAVAFIGGSFAASGYLLLNLEGSLRVLLRSICLQIALLLALFFVLDFFDTAISIANKGFTEPDAVELRVRILPWLSGQADQLAPIARRFTWLLPGFLICAAITLRKAHEGESARMPPGITPL